MMSARFGLRPETFARCYAALDALSQDRFDEDVERESTTHPGSTGTG